MSSEVNVSSERKRGEAGCELRGDKSMIQCKMGKKKSMTEKQNIQRGERLELTQERKEEQCEKVVIVIRRSNNGALLQGGIRTNRT